MGEIEEGASGKDEASEPLLQLGNIGYVDFEVASTAADQVVADVREGLPFAALPRLARALHRTEGRAHLRLPRGLGELLHRLAIAVTARKVHPAVDRRGIAPEDLFHEAHLLDVRFQSVVATNRSAVIDSHRGLSHRLLVSARTARRR
jgi:hypothetical protein